MRTQIFVLALLAFLYLSSQAQQKGEDLVYGKYDMVHSEILGANRTLLVHLPQGYESSQEAYPVIVKLFGTHPAYFLQVSSTMELLSSQGKIPPCIVVGVDQHGHGEVIPPQVPSRQYPHEGDKFLDFVEKELLPYIEDNYRINDYRIFMGSYDCGIFGIYSLFTRPGLFNAYLVNNPGRYGGSSEFLDMIREQNDLLTLDKRFLFISYAEDNYEPMVKETMDFIHFLESDLPPGLQFDYNEFVREPGNDLKAYYYSSGPLLSLFEGYSCPEDVYNQGYEAVKAYYRRFSEKLGYEVDIPYRILDNTANSLWENGKVDEAEKIFLLMTNKKPGRIDAYFRLGDLYSSTGEYKKSVEYYQKCLDLNPNITVAKIRMEQAMEKVE
jgi:hypothetical protein